MALCSDSKNQVIFYFVLVSLFFRICHQTEVYDLSSKSQHFVSAINNGQTNAVDKLDRIRQLGASFFSILNFGGESKIEGRTFGRIRMMRQIMLPMAFLGGFLTAVIIAIKKISIVNMLLTSSVLMLNLAFMFGKIMVSKALWFHHEKFQNQQNHHHNHWQHSPPHYNSHGSGIFDRADDLSYGQQEPISQFSGQNFNQIPSYYINPSQQYPTTFSNQPLAYNSQTALPANIQYNWLQKQVASNALQQPKSSLSPAEMDKLLTDTLARISSDKSRFPHVRIKRKS